MTRNLGRYSFNFESSGIIGGVVFDDREMPEVVRPVQTHSCNIAIVGADGTVPNLDDTDAIICMAQGVKIGIRTADCVPVVVYAPDIRAVAAIHAGWKGSLGGIVDMTLKRLKSLGADLSLAEAAFGPSICGDCYEISTELADRFSDKGYTDCFVSERHIDLESVNRKQLLVAGMMAEKIHQKRYCTFESEFLPSWRRSPTDRRLLTWISMQRNTIAK